MARAVVGGLISSTFITLVVIPVVYTLFHPERRPVHQRQPASSLAGAGARGAPGGEQHAD
jgi:hypothetical protein